MDSVGTRVKKFREASGLSTTELAKLSGIGQSTISSIERDAQSPRVETLSMLCTPLNINLVDLIDTSEINVLPTDIIRLINLSKRLRKKELQSIISLLETFLDDPSK